jgi:hypothetical protein
MTDTLATAAAKVRELEAISAKAKRDAAMGECLIAFINLFCFPMLLYLRGYVAIALWAWYVTPIFHAPAPSIYEAIGLMLGFHIFLPRPRVPETHEKSSAALIMSILWPLGLLFVGWLWHWLQWGV